MWYWKKLRDQELEALQEESQNIACKREWKKLVLFCLKTEMEKKQDTSFQIVL